MTAFSFTTGNPNNLTAGANASMNDVQGPFMDLRTFLNGANLSDTNMQNAGTGLAKLTPLILYGMLTNVGGVFFAGSGGWTPSTTGTGLYTITFSPAFSVNPVVLVTPSLSGAVVANVPTITASAATVSVFNSTTGVGVNAIVGFVAIGPR